MSKRRRLRSLYLCYLSLDDPLVHTQVIAYLRGVAAAGHEIHLLTFEVSRLSHERRRALRASLAAQGITWHSLRYHKRPSLPATAYDTLAGAMFAALLTIRYRFEVLHARNHVPAAMALLSRRLVGRRRPELIFDIRGLMAEEYEDAGIWRRGSLPFRLTKQVERIAIRRATAIVVLTGRVRDQLFGAVSPAGVFVIPCCADLQTIETELGERETVRAELGIASATVMVYLGKFGGWYMTSEMAEFCARARGSIPGLHFLILTQATDAPIRRELARHAVTDNYTIASAPPEHLGRYLGAADFGIGFIRPSPSKISSSPTKIGEYLAAGLPVVCTSGVGDLDHLLGPDVGVLVSEHDAASHARAARQVLGLISNPDSASRCRDVARTQLSLDEVGIPRYRALYDYVSDEAAR